MRIEIAPWRHIETSLPTLKGDLLPEELSAFRAAFVESLPPQRSRKRRSKAAVGEEEALLQEHRRPLLTLTSSRQAIIIVEDEEHPQNTLQESSLLGFRSRSGTLFLSSPRPLNGDEVTLPAILSIYDARHSCLYAVQKKNMQLIRYFNAEMTEVSLESAAVSLSILHVPKSTISLLYGTCYNGQLFIALYEPTETGKTSLRVHYWVAPSTPEGSAHVNTSAVIVPSSACKKRSASEYSDDPDFLFRVDQIFYTAAGIMTIARQYISINPHTMHPVSTNALSYTSSCTQRSLPVPSSDSSKKSKPFIANVRVLGYLDTTEGTHGDTLVVSYGVRTTSSTTAPTRTITNGSRSEAPSSSTLSKEQSFSYFFTCLSLTHSSAMISIPRALPSTMQGTCMLSPSLLGVVTRQQELFLYDILRGGIVYRDQLSLPNQSGSLQCLAQRNQLAILYTNGSCCCVAVASVGRVARKNVPVVLSLAAGLTASLAVSPCLDSLHNVGVIRTFCEEKVHSSNNVGLQQQANVKKAIGMLHDIYKQICASSSDFLQPSFFLTRIDVAFQCAASIVEMPLKELPAAAKTADNPQDAVLSKNGSKIMMNGFHPMDIEVTSSSINANGHSSASTRNRQFKLTELPQCMIDAAMEVVIAILQIPESDNTVIAVVRNSARVLLRRLIRSGKVLARYHFYAPSVLSNEEHTDCEYGSANFWKLLQSLELSPTEATQSGLWSAYTPFDLICDLFLFCPDVSEREMAMAMHYALFYSHPRDVAAFFVREKSLPDDHALRRRCGGLLNSGNDSEPIHSTPHSQYKVVISGASFLMNRFVRYSQCNSALLRDAYQNEFRPMEMTLLLQLVIDLLSGSEHHCGISSAAKNGMKNKNVMKAMLQHVVSLCDCLLESIENSSVGDDDIALVSATLKQIQKMIQSISFTTSSLISLQRMIPEDPLPTNAAAMVSHLDVSCETPVASSRKASTALPPYQIERLQF